jgi:hypothetical protein
MENKYPGTFVHIINPDYAEVELWWVGVMVVLSNPTRTVLEHNEPASEFPSDFLITKLMLVTG